MGGVWRKVSSDWGGVEGWKINGVYTRDFSHMCSPLPGPDSSAEHGDCEKPVTRSEWELFGLFY